jgi:hypothetical protein
MKRRMHRGGPSNSVLVQGNDNPAGEAPPVARSSQKKPYKPPRVIEYGNVARLTAGGNGTHFDPGHDTRIKRGLG